ncbi:MAG: glycosyltransferase family 2 protein [Calditrichaceae bacterium]|nr:glycosyltransferase family 2 protein [Calditrichaceae bacterium]
MISYDVLIPAYNAENTIAQLIDQIKELNIKPEKIIVVDDGSEDQTPNLIKDKVDSVITIKENKGKGFALRNGFNEFLKSNTSDYLICIDADLQHPVSYISKFVEYAEKRKSKFIIGKRDRKFGIMPFSRILSNSTTSLILSIISNQKIEDSQCGFRLIHREALCKLSLQENGFQLESEMIIKAAKQKISIDFIKIPTIYNGHISNINHLGDTIRFIRLVLSELTGRS